MTEDGLHLDVAGGGEIMTAMAAGADPARLVLHGNAKSDEELELAVQQGVGLVWWTTSTTSTGSNTSLRADACNRAWSA
jgi:hypothetical protein